MTTKYDDVIYCTTDPRDCSRAMGSIAMNTPVELGGAYGYVIAVKPIVDGRFNAPDVYGNRNVWEIHIRPTHQQRPQDMLQRVAFLDTVEKYLATVQQITQEDSMKVYEAIVVKVNEQGEPTEVAEVIGAFVAKDVATAQKTVLVDYAQKNSLSGKEAAALRVSVREFCS